MIPTSHYPQESPVERSTIDCYIFCVRLVSWNVNGIRAVSRKGLFTPFVEELEPDVICLQETKAQQSQSEVQLPEYEEHWNSAEKKGYSGTASFSKISPISVTQAGPHTSIDQFGVGGDAFGDPDRKSTGTQRRRRDPPERPTSRRSRRSA